MPFGLTNAPAAFCNLANNVLCEFLNDFYVVHLDEIVIYSRSLEDHIAHLRKVFYKLRQHKLFVKKEKCEFAQTEILFLEHKISKGLVQMDERKVNAIMDWLRPKSVSELRFFLGLANCH